MLQVLLATVIHAALWVYLGCLLVLCGGDKKAPTNSKRPSKPNPADGVVKADNCNAPPKPDGPKPPTNAANETGANRPPGDSQISLPPAKKPKENAEQKVAKKDAYGKHQPSKGNNDARQPEDPDYPAYKLLTDSQRKLRDRKIEEEKREKIKEGFYQSKSDEDETLEAFQSLRQERSDEIAESSKKKPSKKPPKNKK
ncbi:Protein T08H10.3 [Aphelenchoides avenae]|nr:Protein T08H10.3 [Aphelenchus avenae]